MPREPVLRNTCQGPRTSLPQRAFHSTNHVQQNISPTDNPPPSARRAGRERHGDESDDNEGSSPHAHSFVIGPAVIKHTHGLVFRSTNTKSQKTLRVFGDLVSNISATRGRPGMRFCVCGSPSEDLSHIASLTIGCSR